MRAWASRIVVVGALALLASPARAEAPEAESPALAWTRQLIKAFQAVKGGEKGKPLPAADVVHNGRVYQGIDGFFDLDGIASAAIEGREGAFDAGQLKRYQAGFTELLRLVGYRGAGRFFAKATWSLRDEGQKAGLASVVVAAALPEEDLEIDVAFRWGGDAKAPRVRDVAFDGDSLTLDYRNQFGRILDKEGAKGLLERLEKRLAEEQGAR